MKWARMIAPDEPLKMRASDCYQFHFHVVAQPRQDYYPLTSQYTRQYDLTICYDKNYEVKFYEQKNYLKYFEIEYF